MNVKSNKKRKTRIIRLGMKASVIQNGVRISTPIKNNPRVIVRRNGVLNNSQKEWVVEKYIEHIKSVTSIKEVEFIFYTYEELNQKRSDFFMDFWSHGLSVFPTLELDVDNGEYNYKDYIKRLDVLDSVRQNVRRVEYCWRDRDGLSEFCAIEVGMIKNICDD